VKKSTLGFLTGVLLIGIGTYAWMNQWKVEQLGSYTYRTNVFTNITERFDPNYGWISMEQAQKIDAAIQAVTAQQNAQIQQAIQQQTSMPASAIFSEVNIQIKNIGSRATGIAEIIKAGTLGTTIDIVLYDKAGNVAGTGSTRVRARDGDKVPFNILLSMNGDYPQGKWDGTYELTVR
jgi:hypothetical protein